jgi:hypothetical protein
MESCLLLLLVLLPLLLCWGTCIIGFFLRLEDPRTIVLPVLVLVVGGSDRGLCTTKPCVDVVPHTPANTGRSHIARDDEAFIVNLIST